MSIRVVGVKAAIGFLAAKKRQADAAAKKAIHREAFRIQAEVQESIAGNRAEQTSVDTGRFLNSVQADMRSSYEAVVFSNVFYAKFLEHGTVKMMPRRHFGNTLKRERNKIRDNIGRAIKTAVN